MSDNHSIATGYSIPFDDIRLRLSYLKLLGFWDYDSVQAKIDFLEKLVIQAHASFFDLTLTETSEPSLLLPISKALGASEEESSELIDLLFKNTGNHLNWFNQFNLLIAGETRTCFQRSLGRKDGFSISDLKLHLPQENGPPIRMIGRTEIDSRAFAKAIVKDQPPKDASTEYLAACLKLYTLRELEMNASGKAARHKLALLVANSADGRLSEEEALKALPQVKQLWRITHPFLEKNKEEGTIELNHLARIILSKQS